MTFILIVLQNFDCLFYDACFGYSFEMRIRVALIATIVGSMVVDVFSIISEAI